MKALEGIFISIWEIASGVSMVFTTLSVKARIGIRAVISAIDQCTITPDDRELPYGPSVAFAYELSGNYDGLKKLVSRSIMRENL